jgi:two-component system, chemotaxis family, sensor kinase CheA
MDTKKKEFLAKLRETFRVEASEHLDVITAGILEIERAGDAERPEIVERIFREAHSLKGAARSVSLANVEALCLELEGIFAEMKRGDLRLSTEMLDGIHPALSLLSTLCKNLGAAETPEAKQEENRTLVALRGIARGKAPDYRAGAPGATDGPLPLVSGQTPLAAVSPPTASCESVGEPTVGDAGTTPAALAAEASTAAPQTVRVSTQKLGAILLGAEELIGAKIAAIGRSADFRKIVLDLANWNQQRVRRTARQRQSQGTTTAAAEILESELLFTRGVENTLRKLVGAAHLDALGLASIADRLLEDTKKVVLLPCSYLLGAFPKILRDLAREQGKEADLIAHGEDIEIDRRVLDELKDPLMHLLRNCVDHGMEKLDARRGSSKPVRAVVTIAVRAVEGNRVELTMTDDGPGVDVEKVGKAARRLGLIAADEAARLTEADACRLIFHSGLSTSQIITDLSGRGLGLAIVREKVEKLGGTIAVSSMRGAGMTFRVLVPLSLATFRGVLVEVAGRHFVIPTASVVRVHRVKPDDIRTVENRQTIALGEHAVSLVRMRDVLDLMGPEEKTNGAARPLVVVRAADRQIAFLVDGVLGEQEVMVKSLGPQLVRVRNVAGAGVSGSGAIIPILNAVDLVESATMAGAPGRAVAAQDTAPARRPRLVLAEDSITARTLVKGILEAAGYEVVATVDGMDALTRLKTESFDLVVSDVDMPRLNGFELTAKIRADKKLGELPIVLVTALGSQKDCEYGIEVGANAYIVKSEFDQSNLLEIIRRLL